MIWHFLDDLLKAPLIWPICLQMRMAMAWERRQWHKSLKAPIFARGKLFLAFEECPKGHHGRVGRVEDRAAVREKRGTEGKQIWAII